MSREVIVKSESISDTVTERILAVTEYIENGIRTGGEFISEQTPLLVNEILTYYTIHHGFLVFLGLAIMLFCPYFAFRKFALGIKIKNYRDLDKESQEYKKLKKMYFSDVEVLCSSFTILLFLSLVGLIIFFSNIFDFLKVTLAPRLYLIEYLADLTDKL